MLQWTDPEDPSVVAGFKLLNAHTYASDKRLPGNKREKFKMECAQKALAEVIASAKLGGQSAWLMVGDWNLTLTSFATALANTACTPTDAGMAFGVVGSSKDSLHAASLMQVDRVEMLEEVIGMDNKHAAEVVDISLASPQGQTAASSSAAGAAPATSVEARISDTCTPNESSCNAQRGALILKNNMIRSILPPAPHSNRKSVKVERLQFITTTHLPSVNESRQNAALNKPIL